SPYQFSFSPFLIPPLPRSTLFPYTTLFRSEAPLPAASNYREPSLALREHRAIGIEPDRSGSEVKARNRVLGHAAGGGAAPQRERSEEHTSELQSLRHLVCRLLLEKKKKKNN